ncbi:MAG: cytochrome c3 family protein, partial [Phycisphaerae bacterium]
MKILSRVVGLVVLCSILGWAGCGTPRERYRVLSFFFDGVPNPDAPKIVKTTTPTNTDHKPIVALVSHHKPFMEGKCDSCHRSDSGMIMDFSEAYKACVKCHTTVTTKFPRMHGPVASAACQWCHNPHESTEPALLKRPAIKVCTQ